MQAIDHHSMDVATWASVLREMWVVRWEVVVPMRHGLGISSWPQAHRGCDTEGGQQAGRGADPIRLLEAQLRGVANLGGAIGDGGRDGA